MASARLLLLPLAAGALFAAGCGGDGCDTFNVEASGACVPDSITAGRELIIEVREACSLECTRFPSCTATFATGVVTLHLEADRCSALQPIACSTQPCQQRIVPCKLPSLQAGDYPLLLPGGPSRVLRVRTAGESSCRLPVPSGS